MGCRNSSPTCFTSFASQALSISANRQRLAIILNGQAETMFHFQTLLILAITDEKRIGTRGWSAAFYATPSMQAFRLLRLSWTMKCGLLPVANWSSRSGLRQYLVNVLYELKKSLANLAD
jgi:hypothetical protein